MYKVLWFDDEYETLEEIDEIFLDNGIQLSGVSNAKDGLYLLRERRMDFDAILLDGMFFNDSDQSGDPNESAFGKVVMELGSLNTKGIIIPWFILSGQKNFVKERSPMIEMLREQAYADGKVFDKLEDKVELCNAIKKAANKQPLTKARHNNPELMGIFELGYLSDDVEGNVMDLLIKPLPRSNTELKEILTNIRSIQESCLLKLESIRVLDASLRTFKEKMEHLSGNSSYQSSWKPISNVYQIKEIRNLHEWIYHTCGTYIHYLKDQHYAGYMISNYAVESLRTGLLEILMWFKKTYKENLN